LVHREQASIPTQSVVEEVVGNKRGEVEDQISSLATSSLYGRTKYLDSINDDVMNCNSECVNSTFPVPGSSWIKSMHRDRSSMGRMGFFLFFLGEKITSRWSEGKSVSVGTTIWFPLIAYSKSCDVTMRQLLRVRADVPEQHVFLFF
jgi:hypothetical protein